jgi:hypothetical protein
VIRAGGPWRELLTHGQGQHAHVLIAANIRELGTSVVFAFCRSSGLRPCGGIRIPVAQDDAIAPGGVDPTWGTCVRLTTLANVLL